MKLRVKRMGHSRHEAGVVRHYAVGEVIEDGTERELRAFPDRLVQVQQTATKGGSAGGKKVKGNGGKSHK